jgi:hypothetical protein
MLMEILVLDGGGCEEAGDVKKQGLAQMDKS